MYDGEWDTTTERERLEAFPLSEGAAKATGRYPDESAEMHYAFQVHAVGPYAHGDWRFEYVNGDENFVEGWSVQIQHKGPLPEGKSIQEALKDESLWRVDFDAGDIRRREVEGGAVRRAQIYARPKTTKMPTAWLEVDGKLRVADPDDPLVPGVKDYGSIVKIDEGRVDWGAQLPQLSEFFVDGERWKGRIVFRRLGRHRARREDGWPTDEYVEGVEGQPVDNKAVLEGHAGNYWLMERPEDTRPYVLSRTAVKSNWLPPKGVSCLPSSVREKVPENRRYWTMERRVALEARKLLAEEMSFPLDKGEEVTTVTETEEKAVWTRAYINNLPDSAFLYIAPGGKKDDEGKTTPRSLRYFPYRNEKGEVDLPHLRNALARAPQSNLPKAVIQRVQARARRILEEETKDDDSPVTKVQDAFLRVYEDAAGDEADAPVIVDLTAKHLVVDVFNGNERQRCKVPYQIDEDGAVDISPVQEWSPVPDDAEEENPLWTTLKNAWSALTKRRKKEVDFFTVKQTDGRYRWVSISSTGFLDRDGEIVSSKALQAAAEETGDLGPLRFWHVPNLDFGVCDFRVADGVVLIESGLWHSDDVATKVREYTAKHPGKFKVSIGFTYKDEDVHKDVEVKGVKVKRVWEHIRILERSIVPTEWSSNPFTSIDTQGEVSMDANKEKLLREVVGDDELVDRIVARVDAVNTKCVDDAAVYKDDEKSGIESDDADAEPANKDEDLAEVLRSLGETISDFTERIDEMQKELKELRDKQVPLGIDLQDARPSQSDDNVTDKDVEDVDPDEVPKAVRGLSMSLLKTLSGGES